MTGIDSPVNLNLFSPKIYYTNPTQRPDFFIVESFVSSSEFLDNLDLIKLYENF